MKNLSTVRILNLIVLLSATLILSGCLSGGSSSNAAGSSEYAAVITETPASGSGSAEAPTSPVPPSEIVDEGPIGGGGIPATSNPEPSSLLLLGSGLVGMVVYTRARLKSRKRS